MKTRLYLLTFCSLLCKYTLVLGQDSLSNNIENTTIDTTRSVNNKSDRGNKKGQSAVSFLEIDGLIIDETRSKAGRDFYDHFFQQWSPPANVNDFQITIKELPGRGIQTRLLVYLNEEELINTFVQPRYDQVVELAKAAIQFIQGKLIQKMKVSHDLGNNDLKGNGMFD